MCVYTAEEEVEARKRIGAKHKTAPEANKSEADTHAEQISETVALRAVQLETWSNSLSEVHK